ncbi:flagellar filament capping protein FliD [Kineococcus sp. SYSU DK004]|uniref:flagellar filament capping protein FliD n=1 Tax=Kineococcus sp. SYSU DK004 TaxID=3383125 RepID=UPI003D7DC8CB
MSTTVSSSTVDGLISGLDTSSIVNQLIAVDSSVKTRLQSGVSAAQLKVTAYQSVNAKMAALQTAADNLQKATAWSPATATSSQEGVSVATTGSVLPGAFSVTVTQAASGRSVTSSALTTDSTGKITSSLPHVPFDIVKPDGSYVTIAPTSGTLSAVVDAVNKAEGMGLRAVAIRVSSNEYRLQITSTGTGSSGGDFKVVKAANGATATSGAAGTYGTAYGSIDETAGNAGFAQGVPAADARIELTAGGVSLGTLTSGSNTFGDVVPGLSITVSEAAKGKTSSITVASDPKAVASSVKALVDAANAVLSDIALQTRAGVTNANGSVTGGGVLRGDSTLRSLQQQVMSAVTTALGGTRSAAEVGVQSTREGALTFTESTFLSAHAKDPAAVQKLVSPASAGITGVEGLAERLRAVTVTAVGDLKLTGASTDGILRSAVTGQESTIKDLTARIAEQDQRLAQKKVRYQKYYAALEVQLGKLQSQSSWLAGQLGSLPSYSRD